MEKEFRDFYYELKLGAMKEKLACFIFCLKKIIEKTCNKNTGNIELRIENVVVIGEIFKNHYAILYKL